MKEGRPSTQVELDAQGMRVGIVAARFNLDVIGRLVDGALDALRRCGADDEQVEVIFVPGAFELPVVLRRLAECGRFDALVAIGAVIRGETPHFEYVAGAATDGIAAVARETGVPIGFGLITTETVEQALDRAGGAAGNKGEEAALSAIEVANILSKINGR